MTKATAHWIPLESNPQVMNKVAFVRYMERLGVTSQLEFTDVWGLDPELLQFIPRPVAAVVLLFPITPKYEEFRKAEEERIKSQGQTVSPNLYFVRQTIGNACGTIGLLHALANNGERLQLGDGPLKHILEKTKDKSPDERAGCLEDSDDLAKVHEESSQEGQTAAPSPESDVDTHFICFVQRDGSLYEMDGRKPFPINHGSCTDLLTDSVKVIKGFMERDPDNLNFTVIALAAKQDD
ncbi:Ubiquitin carboxyl-terminal hydrolase isozyme L3 [Borealophlyctis nickersoniae]|nr:Ubiquitin carboxyl-terminal hydrolase isozyme L3 [Borealophlyctis nickersoniae]